MTAQRILFATILISSLSFAACGSETATTTGGSEDDSSTGTTTTDDATTSDDTATVDPVEDAGPSTSDDTATTEDDAATTDPTDDVTEETTADTTTVSDAGTGTDEDGATVTDDTSVDDDTSVADDDASTSTDASGPDEDVAVTGDCVTDDECDGQVETLETCEVAICDNGACVAATASNGTTCEDGDPCTSGDTCTDGTCAGTDAPEAPSCLAAVSCESATAITAADLPFTVEGNTADGASHFSSTGCASAGGKGAASNEMVYHLTAEVAGNYAISLADLDNDEEGLDTLLYAFSDCPALTDSICLDAQDIFFKMGTESFSIYLDAGTSAYIIVDGWANDDDITEAGEAAKAGGKYVLTVDLAPEPEVDCGDGIDNDEDGSTDCEDDGCALELACLPMGAKCDDPHVIAPSDLPFSHKGDTNGNGNQFSIAEGACADFDDMATTMTPIGAASSDVVYALTPSEDGTFEISLTGGDEYADLSLAVYEGTCPADGAAATCVVGDNDIKDGGEMLWVALSGGTQYFIVIDGWGNQFDIKGTYELNVEMLPNLSPGSLAITEAMGNPATPIEDTPGEWVEIRNTTDGDLSLKGLSLAYSSWDDDDEMPTEASSTFMFTESLTVAAGGYALLARSDDADETTGSGLSNVTAVYESIKLTNAKHGKLQLIAAGWDGISVPVATQIVDEVIFPKGAFDGSKGTGASWQLTDSSAADAAAATGNDDDTQWCHASKATDDGAVAYATDNYGTPGAANDECPEPTCDDGEANGDEEGVDCGGTTCDACPTCDDGVENGDEDGVDCGGSCTDVCATCEDGVQNGDEAGPDCGGSCASSCITYSSSSDAANNVQDIYNVKCAGCHTDGAGSGGHNIGSDYADAHNDSYYCGGKTVAECTITRILDGSMPDGYGCGGPVADDDAAAGYCVTDSELVLLELWIAHGIAE